MEKKAEFQVEVDVAKRTVLVSTPQRPLHAFGSEQPHWFATPPPPQLLGAPQSTFAPQPSVFGPHWPLHAFGLEQPHTFGTPPPPQVFGAGQPLHVTCGLQAFVSTPHRPLH